MASQLRSSVARIGFQPVKQCGCCAVDIGAALDHLKGNVHGKHHVINLVGQAASGSYFEKWIEKMSRVIRRRPCNVVSRPIDPQKVFSRNRTLLAIIIPYATRIGTELELNWFTTTIVFHPAPPDHARSPDSRGNKPQANRINILLRLPMKKVVISCGRSQ